MNVKQYLEQIEAVIAAGTYKDNWESLSQYEIPQWYQDAKFGIFTHWGVYSVPAYSSEWYPRNMYIEGTDAYNHHIATYGAHKDFGYADFIPMFTAEKFDAKAWLDLFEEAGAKYYMPVAEHHDGFQMYQSELSDMNAYNYGPKRDVLAELKAETEKREMVFCASNHRAENYWFMSGGRDFESGIQEITFQEPYGFAHKIFENDDLSDTTQNVHSEGPSQEHLEDWLARACELVDKYQPKIVWFDWWIQNKAFKPYLKKFAAYYYNRALEWGIGVAINYKYDAYARGTAVFDVERGQLASIRPEFWQTDTAVAKNSWSYTEGNDYKAPEAVVCDLIDIVSKNGALLLNVGPKADGSISDEDTHILKEIGKWMKVNGESIYNTTYWSTFGEGPTEVQEGAFTDVNRADFTSEDIRYTYNAPYIYANVLRFPEDKKTLLKSLKPKSQLFNGVVESVEVLGNATDVTFEHTAEGLVVNYADAIDTVYPVCLKIKID